MCQLTKTSSCTIKYNNNAIHFRFITICWHLSTMLRIHERDMNQIYGSTISYSGACLGIRTRSCLCWFSDPPSDVPSVSSVPFISPTTVSADSSKRSCHSVTSLKEMNGSWKCLVSPTIQSLFLLFASFQNICLETLPQMFLQHTAIMPHILVSQRNVMALMIVSFILIEISCAMFWKDDVVYC